VAATLKASGPWSSVLGPVSFDKKGDVTAGGYVMYIWGADGNYNQM
jgi:branched-chain amino acid transport system substrate-binding protein